MRTVKAGNTIRMPGQITSNTVLRELKKRGSRRHVEGALRFIKGGKGGYGEDYSFLGVRTPVLRELAKKHETLSLEETEKLLHSPYQEARELALLILIRHFQRGNEIERRAVAGIYLDNIAYINSWGLVDTSAYKILGPYLEDRSRRVLYRMARSRSLWKRRIAIVTTFHFIRFSGRKDFSTTLDIAEILIGDEHDLIHKAVGWMLREVGNQDRKAEEKFLRKYYRVMPRTMLRYAIEKFPPKLRKDYLKGEIPSR